MLTWLKKHFIPHEGNEHRPHFLRTDSIRNILILVMLLEFFTFLLPIFSKINTTGGMAAVLPAVLSALTNNERQEQNLKVLNVSSILNKAAQMKAEDMAEKGYFAHTSPEGKTPWFWLEKAGYDYQYAGENLAINFNDSKDVTSAWMSSPTHKANIVKQNYTEVGTGMAVGMYEGRETVFVAQVYANPASKILKQEITKEVEKKLDKPVKEASVLGAEVIRDVSSENKIISESKPNILQKFFASPRNNTNIIFYFIFGVVFVSLMLYLFIKNKNHHKDLITNGMIVLAIIGAILVANYQLTNNMTVLQPLDYVNQEL